MGLAPTLTLARDAMRRLVAGELDAEEVACRIEFITTCGDLDYADYSEMPVLWNFCVYRRYFRAACDAEDDRWYGEIAADVRAEAEFHLGLRASPPR